AVQIAVYAGGIMVLFVFAILLTHQPNALAEPLPAKKKIMGIVACVLGVLVCGYALISYPEFCGVTKSELFSLNMERIGNTLLGTEKYQYLLPFEAISVLLLACIIGGIVIARKDKE
ncbi:MAG: NADH-quinone oxidoreductase subunit J, partial [Muribaculaceae bacterium]|nr:NADH-quinone oxidoreductase subunit J [Muribaculaceae bacterium]